MRYLLEEVMNIVCSKNTFFHILRIHTVFKPRFESIIVKAFKHCNHASPAHSSLNVFTKFSMVLCLS
jgi:hypothetical protein